MMALSAETHISWYLTTTFPSAMMFSPSKVRLSAVASISLPKMFDPIPERAPLVSSLS